MKDASIVPRQRLKSEVQRSEVTTSTIEFRSMIETLLRFKPSHCRLLVTDFICFEPQSSALATSGNSMRAYTPNFQMKDKFNLSLYVISTTTAREKLPTNEAWRRPAIGDNYSAKSMLSASRSRPNHTAT